jgi:hypothetical protein
MTRPIKFRAWNKDKKEMIYLQDTVSCWSQWGDEILPYCNGPHSMFDLMQFTSLLDKNKKEIYEGDIVKISHYHDLPYEIVEFENGGFIAGKGRPFKLIKQTHIEVMGNIYQNPSLLNKNI